MRSLILILLVLSSVLRAQFRDTTAIASDTGEFHMQKSPWVALGLSAVLPGAGQVYLGQWYKAPFILGGIGACLGAALYQNDRYLEMTDSVHNQLVRGDTNTSLRYARARELYRDDRDKFYIYAAIVYIANLIDAYIAAHLYDFDVSDPGTTPYLMMPMRREDPWRFGIRSRF